MPVDYLPSATGCRFSSGCSTSVRTMDDFWLVSLAPLPSSKITTRWFSPKASGGQEFLRLLRLSWELVNTEQVRAAAEAETAFLAPGSQ
jgi:hypothetical protein